MHKYGVLTRLFLASRFVNVSGDSISVAGAIFAIGYEFLSSFYISIESDF